MQSTLEGKDTLSQRVFPSPGYDKLYPKENKEGLYVAAVREQEIFYSPLGEPNLRDLSSFAYQISQGMVCTYV